MNETKSDALARARKQMEIKLEAALETVHSARKLANIVDFDVEYLYGDDCFGETAPAEQVIQITFRLSASDVLKKFLREESE